MTLLKLNLNLDLDSINVLYVKKYSLKNLFLFLLLNKLF